MFLLFQKIHQIVDTHKSVLNASECIRFNRSKDQRHLDLSFISARSVKAVTSINQVLELKKTCFIYI